LSTLDRGGLSSTDETSLPLVRTFLEVFSPTERSPVKPYVRCAMALGLATFSCACSDALPRASVGTGGRSSTHATAKVDAPACEDGRAWREALDALPAAAVTGVRPVYVRDTCAGSAQVTGVKLALLPGAVASPPWAGLLECRAARVAFAKAGASEPSTSPVWTPDGLVDIVVERDRKNVFLEVSAESVPENIRLFRRVAAFARAARE
jgi:hypothetical protein